MTETTDPFADDLRDLPEAAAKIVKARRPQGTREEAIEHGRRLGEDTARQLRESPATAADRVRRAMAYAAWEYDGKPLSSADQREEFKVGAIGLAGYEDWKALKP